MTDRSEGQLLASVLRTFPASRIIPQLHQGGRIRACVKCGHGTVNVNSANVPYHQPCIDLENR